MRCMGVGISGTAICAVGGAAKRELRCGGRWWGTHRVEQASVDEVLRRDVEEVSEGACASLRVHLLREHQQDTCRRGATVLARRDATGRGSGAVPSSIAQRTVVATAPISLPRTENRSDRKSAVAEGAPPARSAVEGAPARPVWLRWLVSGVSARESEETRSECR